MDYEVVVAGGSISGLFCAREIARNGHSVMIIEEDYEVGTPEHCGGMVSMSALEDLGIIPNRVTLDNQVKSAELYAPSGKSFEMDSQLQKVVVVNRRSLDKQIAHQAENNGAEIRVRTSLKKIDDDNITTTNGNFKCKILVDARGVSSIIHIDRNGILQSAQYEVYADWIKKDKVEVYLDAKKYPGFFSWIIPIGTGHGKVGVAGRGINAASSIDGFLKEKGAHFILRKIFSPIWINGPIENFVSKNIVTIGDAAGQTKPTTAGGIYSCGIGGIFAGKAISQFLNSKNYSDLIKYQTNWNEKFGKEFDSMLRARKLLERLDNKTIDKIFESITPETIEQISNSENFDFHTNAIIKLLGAKGSIKIMKAILGGELRKLFT